MRSLRTDSGCRLCPRNCGADREHGKTGFCKVPAELYAARAALHFWEEPCISGERGSGTVFFSGCTLRCVYCQNASIARADAGREITGERLTEIFLELQDQGAHNINLVTPTHYAPWISKALQRAVDQGLKLPVVYNCGGYETLEAVRWMEGLVDIYLTDFKYMDSALAARYSQAPDYPEEAKKALDRMFRQVGTLVFDREGMMQKGIIVMGVPADWDVWIYRALTFLVISCPCALVISIPLSFFAGIGGASKAGVLVKGSNYLETLSKVKTVVFDKTGTLTKGVFQVTAAHPQEMSEKDCSIWRPM